MPQAASVSRISTSCPPICLAPRPPNATNIGLRPEHIRQGEGQDALVKRIEHLGDQTRLHLSFKNHDLTTVTEAHTPLRSGDILKIQPQRPFYFDATGARIDTRI